MIPPDITDPVFRDAVAAIDAGGVAALQALLAAHPRLARERGASGGGYFARPYLLWFVAENPVRNDRLPANIVEVARVILDAARRERAALQEQVEGALGLVCSGRVARESGAQRGLIDLMLEEGARTEGALITALAHHESDAVGHLLARGATPTLLEAACAGRAADVARLAPASGAPEKQMALAGAALYGRAETLALLAGVAAEIRAYAPAGFHAHATALHHAVDSGSLDAVKVLVEAGADLQARDRVYDGTPLDWAVHLKHDAIATYLRRSPQRRPTPPRRPER